MLIGTFQSVNFEDKPLLNENDKIPEGLFKGDVSHGIIWGFPITEDYHNSVVNSWLCAPNNAHVFLIIDTEDYHRVNKIAWYSAINKAKHVNFWDCIDDAADDTYSEIVVPYDEYSKKMKLIAFPAGLLENSLGSDSIIFQPPLPSVCGTINMELYALAKTCFENCRYMITPETVSALDWLNEEQRLAFMEQKLLYHVFSVFYMPFVISLAINSFKLSHLPESQRTKFFYGWGNYASEYFQRFTDLENSLSRWSYAEKPSVIEYDDLRQKFMDFFNSNGDVLIARLEKMSRNEKCPCGSGKKFKKCCGIGYV